MSERYFFIYLPNLFRNPYAVFVFYVSRSSFVKVDFANVVEKRGDCRAFGFDARFVNFVQPYEPFINADRMVT